MLAALAVSSGASATLIHPKGEDSLCLQADKIAVGGTISLANCSEGKRCQQWTVTGVKEGEESHLSHIVLNPEAPFEERLCLQAGGGVPDYHPEDGLGATLSHCNRGWHSARFGTDWLYMTDFGRFLLTDINGPGKHYWLGTEDGAAGSAVKIFEGPVEAVNIYHQWSLE